MKNILATINFEKDEQKLIDQASEIAKAFNAKLWLMHIAAPDPIFVGYKIGPQYIRDTRAHELREEHKQIQNYSNQLKENGIEAEGLLVQGATIEMIMEESKKLNIDLIVAGHAEHSFFYKAFIGSVSSQIIKNSKIPVLIIPFE